MLRLFILACAVGAIYAADCGKPAIPPTETSVNIVGGVEARANSWPWMTEVILWDYYHYCGATLIDNQWVVSAAHCFDSGYSTSDYSFAVGGHRNFENGGEYESTRQTYSAERIILHENYRSASNGHDIALIKLREPVTYNAYVSPACLPDSRPKDGQDSYVTGWGDTTDGGDMSTKLHQVMVPIVSVSDCERAYGKFSIDDTMICAGYDAGGKDSCQGDSGGPLVSKVKDGLWGDEKWDLVGVVSWGSGCARKGKYGVYADVDYLRSWIETTMARY